MDSTLNSLKQSRDQLVNKLATSHLDSDVDKVMVLIDRVDACLASFDAENYATEQ